MKQHKRKEYFVCALLAIALLLCSCGSNVDGENKKSAYDHEGVTYSDLTEEDFATIDYVNQNSDMIFELMGEMQAVSDPMVGPHCEWEDGLETEGAYEQAEGKIFRSYIRLERDNAGHHILGVHCEDNYKDAKAMLEKAGFVWECDEFFNS